MGGGFLLITIQAVLAGFVYIWINHPWWVG